MRTAPLLLLLLLAASIPGCGTLAGVAIGLGIDASQPDSLTMTGSSLASVAPGTEAHLRLMDGTERNVIIGLPDLEPLEAYAATVDERQREAERRVPIPPVIVHLRLDRSIYPHARLDGYDLDGLWIALDTVRSAAYVPWRRIGEIGTVDGELWSGDSLRVRCRELQIPSRSGRWLHQSGMVPGVSRHRSGDVGEFVRTSDVDRIVVIPSSNAVWWGLAAGMATDLVIVAVAAQSMRFNFGGMGGWK